MAFAFAQHIRLTAMNGRTGLNLNLTFIEFLYTDLYKNQAKVPHP